MVLGQLGREDEAEACWEEAIASGGGLGVSAQAGHWARSSGRHPAAVRFLRPVAEVPDASWGDVYAHGQALDATGRTDKALATFERAIQLEARVPWP
jgi:tetratricopeptide (TPR) repeat protein